MTFRKETSAQERKGKIISTFITDADGNVSSGASISGICVKKKKCVIVVISKRRRLDWMQWRNSRKKRRTSHKLMKCVYVL